MSTIAARYYIRQAEIQSADRRVEEAKKDFQRRPTNENLSVLNQAVDRAKSARAPETPQ